MGVLPRIFKGIKLKGERIVKIQKNTNNFKLMDIINRIIVSMEILY